METAESVSAAERCSWSNSSSISSDDDHEEPAGGQVNRVLAMYHDATVLITGGTGFLGKVLLEKALRCLNVRKIFLLIRRKDNLSARERLVRLLQDPVFEKARSCYPSMDSLYAKVEAVQIDLNNGTTLFPRDAVGDDDTAAIEERLLAETEIIFNVLASVKFNESIRNALATNVGGTGKVLQLARRMPRLRSVVHVSTLYSNCHRTDIEERVYDDIPMDHGMILQLTNALSEQEMDRFQHCFLGPMPNTYTFSKQCAEVMIQKDYAQLPIGIFRPPIVISTYQEPVPGWTDNLNGPSGVCMWTVKGLIHTIWGGAGKRANLVPVDYCVNAIIVAAYDIWRRNRQRVAGLAKAVEEENSELLPTYNYMYPAFSLTWGKYMDMVHLGFESRLHQMVWNYSYIITAHGPLFRALSFCFHTVPAFFLDVVQRFRRKKPIYRKAMQKTGRFLELMSYFGTREWTIANGNVRRLRGLLSADESRLLEFDMGTINWAEYFRTYIPGIRRYWFREGAVRGDRWKPAANRRFQFMKRLVQKLVWIWACLRMTRVTSKFVAENLFALLIA
ncbi:hypothetical protein pipiens_013514 [Culex pipiens pipiens]|uniref:Fatty acyl-CoA reductase n=1 Tax=Culex pipiens pipiens TaxID=38569 RepID=A0ABD1CY81_CULPP